MGPQRVPAPLLAYTIYAIYIRYTLHIRAIHLIVEAPQRVPAPLRTLPCTFILLLYYFYNIFILFFILSLYYFCTTFVLFLQCFYATFILLLLPGAAGGGKSAGGQA